MTISVAIMSETPGHAKGHVQCVLQVPFASTKVCGRGSEDLLGVVNDQEAEEHGTRAGHHLAEDLGGV